MVYHVRVIAAEPAWLFLRAYASVLCALLCSLPWCVLLRGCQGERVEVSPKAFTVRPVQVVSSPSDGLLFVLDMHTPSGRIVVYR